MLCDTTELGTTYSMGGVSMPIRERTSHEIPGKVPASAAGLFRNHGTGASDNPPFVGETNTRYGKVLKYAVGNENKQRGVGGKVTLTR